MKFIVIFTFFFFTSKTNEKINFTFYRSENADKANKKANKKKFSFITTRKSKKKNDPEGGGEYKTQKSNHSLGTLFQTSAKMKEKLRFD